MKKIKNSEKESSVAYDIAELCLADNSLVSDAVNDYLWQHPRFAAEVAAETLRSQVFDLMLDFSLDD